MYIGLIQLRTENTHVKFQIFRCRFRYAQSPLSIALLPILCINLSVTSTSLFRRNTNTVLTLARIVFTIGGKWQMSTCCQQLCDINRCRACTGVRYASHWKYWNLECFDAFMCISCVSHGRSLLRLKSNPWFTLAVKFTLSKLVLISRRYL